MNWVNAFKQGNYMNIRFLFFLLLGVFSYDAIAQNRIGSWRSHLPYANASKLILAGDKTYCSTDGGLFYFNQADNSIDKISKENGLSDTEISTLAYSSEYGITIIAYSNANIDFILNNSVINFPDIMRKQIMGDKRINSINIQGDYAYFSTGFGIVALNLVRREISWTIDKIGEGGLPIKVNETCIEGGYYYAATDQGIYRASLTAQNIQDYNYWNRISDIPNFNKKFNAIIAFDGIVYASHRTGTPAGDIIYSWDGAVWTRFPPFNNDDCNHFSNWNGKLVVSSRYHVHVYQNEVETDLILVNSPKCAYIDQNSVLWAADSEKGLARHDLKDGSKEFIVPNGPSTNSVSDIKISGDIVYSVPGGPTSSNNNQFRNGEVNTFKDSEWNSFKRTEYKDFYRIAVDPADPKHYFVGSWGYGLFEFRNDSLYKRYKEDNSSLQTIIPGDFSRLGGLSYDNEGNLWVSNASVPQPLSVLLKTGEWQSFDLNNILPTTIYTGDIVVAQSGYKWMILTSHTRGLLVMDDNGTIENPDDDRYLKLDIKDENNAIITNDVYSIAEDREGNIWLGTNKGILVYYNPWAVFDGSNFYAQSITIPRIDDPKFGDPLLGTETVTSIVVDGANRKWLGTKNAGVSLVSDDGLKQIHNFTMENSPLLSNSITTISINEKNGEVFFGTDKGIISFVAEATGPEENYQSVLVFPNPVRESYTGDIAISGLTENTLVKITDLNGNLVFETISLGGQALWDGNNFRGERVRTGVYLVFCSSDDGTLSHVTKLLFIH